MDALGVHRFQQPVQLPNVRRGRPAAPAEDARARLHQQLHFLCKFPWGKIAVRRAARVVHGYAGIWLGNDGDLRVRENIGKERRHFPRAAAAIQPHCLNAHCL